MLSKNEIKLVKKIINHYGKRIFRIKTLARLYSLNPNSFKLAIPELLKSGFVRIYNYNGRYTLYEVVNLKNLKFGGV